MWTVRRIGQIAVATVMEAVHRLNDPPQSSNRRAVGQGPWSGRPWLGLLFTSPSRWLFLHARFADLFGRRRPPEPVLALSILGAAANHFSRLALFSSRARVPVATSGRAKRRAGKWGAGHEIPTWVEAVQCAYTRRDFVSRARRQQGNGGFNLCFGPQKPAVGA